MYSALTSLVVIFKVIRLRFDNPNKKEVYDKRLLVAIKSFLTEHTLFPV